MSQSNIIPLAQPDRPVWIDTEDFSAKTKHLTKMQRGMVFCLSSKFFLTGARLPCDDDRQLAELSHVSLRTWRKNKAAVMLLFRSGKPAFRFRWTSPY